MYFFQLSFFWKCQGSHENFTKQVVTVTCDRAKIQVISVYQSSTFPLTWNLCLDTCVNSIPSQKEIKELLLEYFMSHKVFIVFYFLFICSNWKKMKYEIRHFCAFLSLCEVKFSEKDVEVVLQKHFFTWIFQAKSPFRWVCNAKICMFMFCRIPGKTYMIIAFLTVGTMGLSNTSLGYLNYPTQVIFKCCKLIPVMIGGVFIQGKCLAIIWFFKKFLLWEAVIDGILYFF